MNRSNIRTLSLLAGIILILTDLQSQTGDILWTKKFSEDGDMMVVKALEDNEGNLIVTGNYNSQYLPLADGQSLINQGQQDIFIAKYTKSGNLVWKQFIGGSGYESLSASDTDNGNIYLTGYFTSSVVKIGTSQISSSWANTVFTVKLDKNGILAWSKLSTKESPIAIPTGIYAGNGNNVYITGYFTGRINFGKFDLVANNYEQKSFVCKFSKENGDTEWGTYLVNGELYFADGVFADEDGTIYFAGKKREKLNPAPPYYNENFDYFQLSAFDPDKNKLWAITDTTITNGILIKPLENRLVIAAQRVEPEGIGFCGTNYRHENSSQLLLVNRSGEVIRKKYMPGIFVNDMFVDQTGDIYVTGSLFANEVVLDDYHLVRMADSSWGNCTVYPDIFIARFDSMFNTKLAVSYRGGIDDQGKTIHKDSEGNIYLGAIFESGRIEIGGHQFRNNSYLNDFSHVSGQYYDRTIFGFFLKMSGIPLLLPTVPQQELILYPVPAGNWLNIELPGAAGNESTITFYDESGRPVLQTSTYGIPVVVDVSALPAGYYVVRIVNNTATYTAKFVK